ncbi:MAG: Smr/MutS family protein [bacterium]|nr:Smr/MutS family protein [bacterium]
MIPLLERLAAGAAEAGRAPVASVRALALLEWDRLTGQVAAHCLSPLSAQAVRARRPLPAAGLIEPWHELADELRAEGDRNQWPPLNDPSVLLALLDQPPPVRLEGPDLVHVASLAGDLDALRAHFLDRRESCPRWSEAALAASPLEALRGALLRALEPDGRLRDDASPKLGPLRRRAALQERAVRQEVGEAMTRARTAGWTTGDEVTLRGDRFCLPLRSGDSRRVDGIVHDRSQTGATLFVEPAGVVRLSNELTSLRLEIAAEEARILFELNRAVERAAPALRDAAGLMLLVDEVRAGLLWSRAVRGSRVRTGVRLRVSGGRHPLLMEALGGGDPAAGRAAVVPLDLAVPDDCRVLVISGPNAGGKSVALKTVGVLCLLAQCGWDVPALEDTELPPLGALMVDLGDDQSIAQSLSSFSAHMRHLGEFLAAAAPGTLVLSDEIGSGTDPQEGTALAFAALEQLAEQGALVLASTHFGLLKAAVHDHPLMQNAAMDFDERDLRPLYTFRVGDPGTSHAFDIARRMGLPAELIERARGRAGHERVQVEQLLIDLDRRARELRTAGEQARDAAAAAATREVELAARLRDLERERKQVLAAARREAEKAVREGRRAIENAVREIRAEQGAAPAVRRARDRLAELERGMDADQGEASPRAADFSPQPGDRVRIPHLNLVGRILEVRGGRLVADADGLRLTLGPDAVRPLGADDSESLAPVAAPWSQETGTGGGWSWQGEAPVAEPVLDLRGLTGEEGWQLLDQLLDRAIPAGLGAIEVIHGRGTGRLRGHLQERLRGDRRVASFKEDSAGGVTLVRLA